MSVAAIRTGIYAAIADERIRQDAKFGWMENPRSAMPNGSEEKRLAVLAEEFGEVARAVCEHDEDNLEEELVQVAAVCVAWLEARRQKRAFTEGQS